MHIKDYTKIAWGKNITKVKPHYILIPKLFTPMPITPAQCEWGKNRFLRPCRKPMDQEPSESQKDTIPRVRDDDRQDKPLGSHEITLFHRGKYVHFIKSCGMSRNNWT